MRLCLAADCADLPVLDPTVTLLHSSAQKTVGTYLSYQNEEKLVLCDLSRRFSGFNICKISRIPTSISSQHDPIDHRRLLLQNVFSILRPDWFVPHICFGAYSHLNAIIRLVVSYPETLGTKITVEYGLMRSCERHVVRMPIGDGSQIAYTDYKCRPFPARLKDSCEDENQLFCIEWTSAGYFAELAAGFAAVSCLAIVFGVTTHSRRRRIWRVVATLVALQGPSKC